MHAHVTLLGPGTPAKDTSSLSALPPDLLQQVRGRVRLLSLLMLAAFAFEPLLYLVVWTLSRLTGTVAIFGNRGFVLADAAVALASAGSGGLPARARRLPRGSTRSGWSTRW